jgi:hypothetical protein
MQSPSHAQCAATLSGQDIGTLRRMQHSDLDITTLEDQIEAAAVDCCSCCTLPAAAAGSCTCRGTPRAPPCQRC